MKTTLESELIIPVRMSANRILAYLLFVIGLLVFVHLALGALAYYSGSSWAKELYEVFSVGYDQSVPTHFAVCQWFVGAALAFKIGARTKNSARERRGWFIIAAVALFNSIDELAMFHERLTGPVRSFLGAEGFLFYAWVIPYAAIILVLCLILTKFLLSISRDTLLLLVISGVVFVLGAVGLEMVGANIVYNGSIDGLIYKLVFTLEETLEMLGVSLFIYTLLREAQRAEL